MVKIVALIKIPASMSRDEFLRHWQVDHPAYVWALPGVRRYIQNVAMENRRSWSYDGVAELWFDTVRDVALAFDSVHAEPMHRHEELFIESLDWLLTEETDVPAPA